MLTLGLERCVNNSSYSRSKVCITYRERNDDRGYTAMMNEPGTVLGGLLTRWLRPNIDATQDLDAHLPGA